MKVASIHAVKKFDTVFLHNTILPQLEGFTALLHRSFELVRTDFNAKSISGEVKVGANNILP